MLGRQVTQTSGALGQGAELQGQQPLKVEEATDARREFAAFLGSQGKRAPLFLRLRSLALRRPEITVVASSGR